MGYFEEPAPLKSKLAAAQSHPWDVFGWDVYEVALMGGLTASQEKQCSLVQTLMDSVSTSTRCELDLIASRAVMKNRVIPPAPHAHPMFRMSAITLAANSAAYTPLYQSPHQKIPILTLKASREMVAADAVVEYHLLTDQRGKSAHQYCFEQLMLHHHAHSLKRVHQAQLNKMLTRHALALDCRPNIGCEQFQHALFLQRSEMITFLEKQRADQDFLYTHHEKQYPINEQYKADKDRIRVEGERARLRAGQEVLLASIQLQHSRHHPSSHPLWENDQLHHDTTSDVTLPSYQPPLYIQILQSLS